MAIQMRRGRYQDFDPTRMVPGEWAVVLSGDPGTSDGSAIYICVSAGTVKRVTTYEDLLTYLANAEADIVANLSALVDAAVEDAEAAATNAGQKANAAEAAATNAGQKANAAEAAAADAMQAAAEARGAVRPDMAIYLDYDTVGTIQYISLVDANE